MEKSSHRPSNSPGSLQMEDNRKKALSAALGQIEKQFGKGSVMRLGDASAAYDVEAVSTGSLGLDIALGIGGLPRGRVVEIYGPESSGKTTLTLQVIAEVQLTGNIKRSNTIVIFINQIRMKIGVMFGNPETTTGGNALKFYASVRLDIRRIGAIKTGEEVTGNQTRVKVVKNKVAPPFREAEFEIMYGQGISREGEIIELGSSLGIIEKSGAWYAYKGSRIGQGKDNARAYLQSNREVAREIEEQVRARLLPPRQQRNGNGEQAANSA